MDPPSLHRWTEFFQSAATDDKQDGIALNSPHVVKSEFYQALCKRYSNSDASSAPPSHCPIANAAYHSQLLSERFDCYRTLVNSLPAAGFDSSLPVAIVASPGRDRLFMGHTDLQGLGGFTFDCATREELLCAAQVTNDGNIHLHNSDSDTFKTIVFPVQELLDIADQCSTTFGTRCFDARSWCGYVKAALTYMLCEKFDATKYVRESLGLPIKAGDANPQSQQAKGVRFFVSTSGRLKLSHAGGISSSAALTGAISLSLVQLFAATRDHIPLNLLAQVDYGEYFLGKHAGAADKMAQLYAIKGRVTVISSLPESLLRVVAFPTNLCALLVCTAPIPRLTVQGLSRPFLSSRGYTPEHQQLIVAWAEEVMASFGSVSYVVAVELLEKRLQEQERVEKAGLTMEEAQLLRKALMTHPPLSFTPSPLPSATSASPTTAAESSSSSSATASSSSSSSISSPSPSHSTPCTYQHGLLRELCHNGSLESLAPHLAGWSRRHQRYHLLYRMLRLLPQRYVHVTAQGKTLLLHLRKAALYGLSEVERGWEYLRCMDEIQTLKQQQQQQQQQQSQPCEQPKTSSDSLTAQIDQHLNRIFQLVALAHDGDRAVVDYRSLLPADAVSTPEEYLRTLEAEYAPCYKAAVHALPPTTARYFALTKWATDVRNDVSEARISSWLSGDSTQQELADLPGGFERSIIDMDEMADLVHERYASSSSAATSCATSNQVMASLRISAAGLGGRVCAHARPEVSSDLEQFLQSHGFEVRFPIPSAPTQTMPL